MHNFDDTLQHSDMLDWAKQEVMIACQREKEDETEEPDLTNYALSCYNSALKAYMSLSKDGHSGASIGLTKHILNRLIDGRPLTAIEDVPEIWNHIGTEYESGDLNFKRYQCSRMSSLFKKEYPDGTVTYNDVDRFICYNVDTPDIGYTSGLVSRTLDSMMPITMPYMPGKRMRVECDEFLVNESHGDFDTVGILSIKIEDDSILPIVPINKFFTEDETGKFVEITEEQFNELKTKKIK